MDSNSSSDLTMDSIDVTIFEDFYGLDVTLPYTADSGAITAQVISSSMELKSERVSSELSSEQKQYDSEIAPEIVPEQEPVSVPECEMEQTISMFTRDLTKFDLGEIPTELICLPSESEKVTDQTFSEFCSVSGNQVENEKPSETVTIDLESDEDLEATICMSESDCGSPEIIEAPLEVIPSVSVTEKDPEQTCCLLSASLEDHLTEIPSEVLSSLSEPLIEQIIRPPTANEKDFKFKIPEVIQSSPEKDLEQTFSVFSAATNDCTECQIPLEDILSPEKNSDHLLSILSTSPKKQLLSEISSENIPPSLESGKMLEQTISVFTADNQFELSRIPLELISLPEEPSGSEEDLDRTFTVSEGNTNDTEMPVPCMIPEESAEQEALEQTFSLFSTSPNLVKTPSQVMSPPSEKMEEDQMHNLLPADIEKHLESTIQPEILPTHGSISELEQTISVFTSEFKIPSAPGPEKDLEQTFSVFSSNLNNLRLNKTPSRFKQPLIIFSPAVVSQQSKSMLSEPVFSPVKESSENQDPQIEACTPKRPETPIDMDKTLVLKQISARTNQSPLYTPVTAMVSRFRNLALESPYPLSNINNKQNQETPKTVKEPSPLKKSGQHQRLEKVKLVSPLLRSPKFRPLSTRLPSRSNSNVKKSPTIAQYKANPPVNQGSRIPVLKLI